MVLDIKSHASYNLPDCLEFQSSISVRQGQAVIEQLFRGTR